MFTSINISLKFKKHIHQIYNYIAKKPSATLHYSHVIELILLFILVRCVNVELFHEVAANVDRNVVKDIRKESCQILAVARA